MPDPQKELCSRCENELDTEGSPHWCKECRAKYQREYQSLRREMANGRGFAAGAEAMRRDLLSRLMQMAPTQIMRVDMAHRWIREFPAPAQK